MLEHLAIGAGIVIGFAFLFLVVPVIMAPRVDRFALWYMRLRMKQGGIMRARVAEELHLSVTMERMRKANFTIPPRPTDAPTARSDQALGVDDLMDDTDTQELKPIKDQRAMTTRRLTR